jgi:phosphoethanolamine N-methyltransferase
VSVGHCRNAVCRAQLVMLSIASPKMASPGEGQYSDREIRKYEAVYGRDFISPGGLACARRFVAALGLRPGAHVLDAGCGLGGSAFVMAREYQARVTGIDLSVRMIELARQRRDEYALGGSIEFVHGDCLEVDATARYEAIYSRDAFLHVHDKNRLFAVLLRALKPGGQMLITDYCAGPAPWSAGFTEYVAQRGYDLHTVAAYAQLLCDTGFDDVQACDLSAEFQDIHAAELERLACAALADAERAALQSAWQSKLDRIRAGEQRWGLFRARRPR